MPGEPIVSVRGEAVLEVPPEVALVTVTVMARDKDRHRAVTSLAERGRRVTALVKRYGEAVEKLDTDPVSVHPEFADGKPRERVAGYVAHMALHVTVADFAVLGQLIPGLAGQEMAELDGPAWALRPTSPVYREARLAAAKDAAGRARDYAEAFGGRITGLVELADHGLLEDGHLASAAAKEPRLLRRGPAPPAEFGFEPAAQTVHAQVEARFTMTAPSLGS
jgi:uncharacterized protein YggE